MLEGEHVYRTTAEEDRITAEMQKSLEAVANDVAGMG
jgi:hypothetical protein